MRTHNLPRHQRRLILAILVLATLAVVATDARQERPTGQGFTFRTAVELINVTVTVTDDQGRFVPNLRAEDFTILEEGQPQTISQFDSERVPVSLGIALDTSGSMVGDKIVAARAALDRFLFDLLGPNDEVFLYRFDSRPQLVQGWTEDRKDVSRALGNVKPVGGTAIYDTVAEAVPLATRGTRRKKAIVVISDGNDTSSRLHVEEVQQLVRESEVLVYAIGIDASGSSGGNSSSYSPPQPSGSSSPPRTGPQPVPSPFPGKPSYVPPAPKPSSPPPPPPSSSRSRSSNSSGSSSSERLNIEALRRLTDDSGGRTEIIVSPRDLDPATAGVANELSRQYFLGYTSTLPKDGRWHSIEVRVRNQNYRVRARRGFIAG